ACYGADIEVSRAVLALRDIDDPVLDDHHLFDVAWYHTSIHDHWPSSSQAMPGATIESSKGLMPAEAVERARVRYENQALHLGTYEAAVESMLRRMSDQADGGSQFYLYRVALRREGLVIEPNWRNENSAEAAQISQTDLGEAHGIRYLNVHESPGSVSLAVCPTAIASVQCLALPANGLNVLISPGLLGEIAQMRTEVRRIEALRSSDLSRLERLRQDVAIRRGSEFMRTPTPSQLALSHRIRQLSEEQYLAGVSPSVRARFIRALQAWRAAQEGVVDDADYVSHFASMAATLTQHMHLLQLLATQPCRLVSDTSA
ncbi:MAG TPA: hypothetical protein VGP24_11020, partial [Glaciihabitans sp.]|nr:hypothetical protein [Glaciihabitans sp.]